MSGTPMRDEFKYLIVVIRRAIGSWAPDKQVLGPEGRGLMAFLDCTIEKYEGRGHELVGMMSAGMITPEQVRENAECFCDISLTTLRAIATAMNIPPYAVKGGGK